MEKQAEFSNHWKTFFQSLENPPFADEPADWPESGRGSGPGQAFEVGEGVGGEAKAAVEEIVGAQAGVFLHQGLDFVDGAGEVGREFFDTDEVALGRVAAQVVFEEAVLGAEGDQQDVAFAGRKAVAADEGVETGTDAAFGGGFEVLHGRRKAGDGRADAVADFAEGAVPDVFDTFAGVVAEVHREGAVGMVAAAQEGGAGAVEGVAVPREGVGADGAGEGGEVFLDVASGRHEAQGPEEAGAAAYGGAAVAEEVAEVAQGVEGLELVGGVDGVELGRHGFVLSVGWLSWMGSARHLAGPVPTAGNGENKGIGRGGRGSGREVGGKLLGGVVSFWAERERGARKGGGRMAVQLC